MLDVCSQLWNKCANFKGLVDEPDIRLKTDKGCQQGPSSLSTGSNHTGVSLGLGTQKWRDPFIFIIWRRQEIIMTLTYQKLGFSFKYFKTILLHFDILTYTLSTYCFWNLKIFVLCQVHFEALSFYLLSKWILGKLWGSVSLFHVVCNVTPHVRAA